VKKVRDEMDALRKQSSHNANSQQVHLERIDALERQLTVFREESLKLFQKVVAREKQIAELHSNLKEAQSENAECMKNMKTLIRRNKELEAALMKIQLKDVQSDNLNPPQASMRGEV
jgi:chromosome segregation ATPase